MNKRERVVAAIRGERVDCVPSGFSIHFPEGCKEGQAAVNAHLRFFQETDTDIIKIMNENLVPYMLSLIHIKMCIRDRQWQCSSVCLY